MKPALVRVGVVGAHTSLTIHTLSSKLMSPHGNGNLLAALTVGLDLDGEGAIDIDVGALPLHTKGSLVEVCRDSSNKGNQIAEGEDQLVTDILVDLEQRGTLKEIGEGH